MLRGKSVTVLGIILLACVMVLGACGKSSETDKGTSNKASSGTESQEKSGNENAEESSTNAANAANDDNASEVAVKLYKHVSGETEIPVEPKRIVSDWYYGDFVALGVKPVGLTSYVLNNHPFIEAAGTEDIGSTPNLEKVIELEPDLIVLYGNNENYEQFSKIAPTIGMELYPDPMNSVRVFGDIVGKKEEAEQWISNFEAKVDEAKQTIAGKLGSEETFTIFTVWRKELRVYGDINMGGYLLYKALQLQPQERVLSDVINGDAVNAGRAISMEEMASFAGDNIILTVFDGEELEKDLKESAIWQGLDAVKNNKVYEVDFNLLYNEDPVAMEHQLDILTELITGAP
ncbi:iron ABC transporter substrate-binding protein [Paenibacillaceae bacterium]|nr:iron ABC transporter substrate-binding protein [Paenibacillaceae bacterium]